MDANDPRLILKPADSEFVEPVQLSREQLMAICASMASLPTDTDFLEGYDDEGNLR